MDQNADGTSDENPLTTPFTSLTPGDVYAIPHAAAICAGHVLGARTLFDPSASPSIKTRRLLSSLVRKSRAPRW